MYIHTHTLIYIYAHSRLVRYGQVPIWGFQHISTTLY